MIGLWKTAFRWGMTAMVVWGVAACSESKSPGVAASPKASPSTASLSPTDYAASQFYKCWYFDAGAKNAASQIVRLHVLLNADGSVMRADIVDSSRYGSDSDYRSAVDGARRAVHLCSPIKLPPGTYDSLKDIILTFDPRDAVR